MEKVTFDLWENVQDNNFSKVEELIQERADLDYQLQAYGSVPPPPPYYRLTVRVYYFPEHYQIWSTRLYSNLCQGDTILHICAREGFVESVRWLLKAKVDITLRNDRNKTAQEVANPEALKVFHEFLSGENKTVDQPSTSVPLEEYGSSSSEKRWEEIRVLLEGNVSKEIPPEYFEKWPLYESLTATRLLRESRVHHVEQTRTAFNAKLKSLKQAQSNLGTLREKKMGIGRNIQELKSQISQLEKQLTVVEVEEFRAQRETDVLKAEYANESELFSKLQKARDQIIQISAPLEKMWQGWLTWFHKRPLEEFDVGDVITLLGALEMGFDVDQVVQTHVDGEALWTMCQKNEIREKIKITAYGDYKRVVSQLNRIQEGKGLMLAKEGTNDDINLPSNMKIDNLVSASSGNHHYPASSSKISSSSFSSLHHPADWKDINPHDWKPRQVADWLKSQPHLQGLVQPLTFHKIDGSQLLELVDDEWKNQVGVTDGNLLASLSQIIQQLAGGNGISSSSSSQKRWLLKEDIGVGDGIQAKKSRGQQPPGEFLCKLTGTIMTDPVLAADGNTYERSAIEEWFKSSNLSPVNHIPLDQKILFPNLSLKNLITQWNQQ